MQRPGNFQSCQAARSIGAERRRSSCPLFGKTRLIKEQGGIAVTPQGGLDLVGYLSHPYLGPPGRLAQQMLHG